MHAPASRPPLPLPLVFAVGAFGIATYSGMDAVMKGLTIELGVYNAMLWRMWAAALIAGAIYAARRPHRPSRAAMQVHLKRGAVGCIMALLFFWGLARVPMAQGIALTYIAPLLALFLAALLLGEKVRGRTVAASLIALGGIGLILIAQARSQMGDQALLGAIAILASAVCYAWNIILMRQQALVAGPFEICFWQALIVGVLLLPAAPFLGTVPDLRLAPAILLAAALSTVSMFLLSWAYARGEASYLAPTEYTSFMWAALFGWLVFGERVSPYTLAGAALIIGGCILAARHRPGLIAHEAEAALP